jgi:amino acid transporter
VPPGCSLILLQFSGWKVFLKGNWAVDTFVTNYIPLVLFPILYIGAKFVHRQPMPTPLEMDFYSGIAEIEADTYDEPPPKNAWEKFWVSPGSRSLSEIAANHNSV